MGDSEPKKERRSNKGRRKWDLMMEDKVNAIGLSLSQHLTDCARNYELLKESVDKVRAYVEPQIAKAQARAATWERIKEAAMTDAASGFIKAFMFAAAFATITAMIPLLRAILTALLVNLHGG